jgi:protein-S-isoprenylcysteine O-methyltransferase Ste14
VTSTVLLRHLLSIAILPFTVTVLIPLWIARRYGVGFSIGATPGQLLLQVAGVLILGLGLGLFFASLKRFATEGKGTLAPWDPPRNLVVTGVYRYVRNPMISGVVLVLVGEALLLRSTPHGRWAALFLLINALYIPLFEEPLLAAKFGDRYREYCRHVPRLLPRVRPWEPGSVDRRQTGQDGGTL